MKLNILASFFLIIILSGCVVTETPAQLSVPFQLRLGESAYFSSEDLTIEFFELNQDSRCPIGVQCIWEGEGIIKLQLSKDNQSLGELTLSTRDPVQTVGEYTIELVSLEPYPVEVGKLIPAEEYVATLNVSK